MDLSSPADWLEYLERELDLRRPLTEKYEAYYDGRHPLSFSTSKFKEAFGDLFAAFADNYMQLVVDVPVARLRIDGFDFGDDAANEEAQKLWRKLNMPRRIRMAHTEAIKNGTSYLLVDPNGNITVESALQCYVELDPADPENRLAGLKKWQGLDGFAYANVYLPDGVYKFRRESAKSTTAQTGQQPVPLPRGAWSPKPGDERVDNPFDVVSLIPLANNASLVTGGRSDLDVAIPLQNAVNKECADLIVASEFQAFKQRVLTGVEVPKYPEDHPDPTKAGKPIDSAELMAAISRTWFIESSDARVTELGETDLKNYVQVIEMFIQHIATKVQIPPQYLLSSTATLANIAAEAMAVIESGFIAKCESKQEDFGPSHAEAVRLSLQARKINVEPGITKWRPASPPPIVNIADAMTKLATVGVPFEWIWEQIGATPEQQVEWRAKIVKRQQAEAKAAAEAAKAAGLPTPATPDGPPDLQPDLPAHLRPALERAAINQDAPPTVGSGR